MGSVIGASILFLIFLFCGSIALFLTYLVDPEGLKLLFKPEKKPLDKEFYRKLHRDKARVAFYKKKKPSGAY